MSSAMGLAPDAVGSSRAGEYIPWAHARFPTWEVAKEPIIRTRRPLAALGLATQIGGVTVTASIYQWNPATQSFGPLMDQVTTSNSTVGFFLASLSQPLSLTGGQPYAVRLDYALSGSAVLGAAPVTIGGSGINGYLDVTAGLSYYLDPGTSQWIDMETLAFLPYSGSGPSGGGSCS